MSGVVAAISSATSSFSSAPALSLPSPLSSFAAKFVSLPAPPVHHHRNRHRHRHLLVQWFTQNHINIITTFICISCHRHESPAQPKIQTTAAEQHDQKRNDSHQKVPAPNNKRHLSIHSFHLAVDFIPLCIISFVHVIDIKSPCVTIFPLLPIYL